MLLLLLLLENNQTFSDPEKIQQMIYD